MNTGVLALLGRGWGAGAVAFAALALAGCSGDMFSGNSADKWFAKPLDVFAKPDWALASSTKDKAAGGLRPVAPEDFVDASGQCAGEPAPNEAATGAVAAAEGAAATSPAGAAPANFPAFGAPVIGGVALTMTECEVVRRAGQPENVEIGANESGERRIVLTYLRGNWPGIYRFTAGRLNEVERAPAPPEPPKPPPKKKKPAKPKTAAR